MAFKNNILFDVLANILVNKSLAEYTVHRNSEDFAAASKFMVLRYLTMSNSEKVRNIVLDNYLTLERMPMNALYYWLILNIPKQNNAFIRYIK